MEIDIYFDGQLIYTSLKLTFRGKSKIIDKLVVDTGAAKSFISVDIVEDIDITYEDRDYITTVYGIGGPDNSFQKTVNCIGFGSQNFYNYSIDFGVFASEYGINGLIGLDLLRDSGVIIDLKNMKITEIE
ncbi:MAG: aspartyl protease [Ruminiclostridium sp.]|nr:aspartyl protease [Ruminiclostridium sp.]